MKLFVDIPAGTLDRVTDAIIRGGYRSLSDFVVMSLENQVSHELASGEETTRTSSPARAATKDRPKAHLDLALKPNDPPDTTPLGVNVEAVGRSVLDYGWLLGLINRVFPIKVAARVLLENSESELPDIDAVREGASTVAAMLASRLGAGSERAVRRDESLAIGLPTREPIFRSKERFADQFVGRIDQSGRLFGALFELGLANIAAPNSRKIGLTVTGLTFARLRNPVLDDHSREQSLSNEERLFYVRNIATSSVRESSCFLSILEGIGASEASIEQLDDVAQKALGENVSLEAMRNQKTAAIGRLRDLGLVLRDRRGSQVAFSLTESGRTSTLFLRDRRTQDNGIDQRRER